MYLHFNIDWYTETSLQMKKGTIFVVSKTEKQHESSGKKIVILSGKDTYKALLKEFPDIMDVTNLCRALRISEKTAYKLLKSGQIPSMKVGRAYRIPKLHVLAYLKLIHTV